MTFELKVNIKILKSFCTACKANMSYMFQNMSYMFQCRLFIFCIHIAFVVKKPTMVSV